MKNQIYVILFITILVTSFSPKKALAQVSQKIAPYSFSLLGKIKQKGDTTVYLPKPQTLRVGIFSDRQKLRQEDAINDQDKEMPYRFGFPCSFKASLQNSGTWATLANGDRVWRLKISAISAQNLSLTYSYFHLPKGSTFHLYNPRRTTVLGAFTSLNNKPHHRFSTGLTEGGLVILEYYEPADVKGQGRIEIDQVIYGYRGFFGSKKQDFGDAGTCNTNVNCPEASDWQEAKKSVVLIANLGQRLCTGTMLNTTRNDCTPYLLTANHCPLGNLETALFMFNYESPSCENIEGRTDQTISGATHIANNATTDFSLLELSLPPPADYDVFYAGWSRADSATTTAACMHHPRGDIKKISFNNDQAPNSASWLEGLPDLYWEVDDWEVGTTESSSSGAALFDQNQRIIGQLRGGTASCQSLTFDSFGKLSASWSLGNNADSRLKDWLDPLGTEALFVEGRSCTEIEYRLDVSALQLTSTNDLVCSIETLEPQLIIRNNGSDTLSQITIFYQLDEEEEQHLSWEGSLAFFEKTTIKLPPINTTFGTHILKVKVASPNAQLDENENNNTAQYHFDIIDGQKLKVNLTADLYTNETSFDIVDSTGQRWYFENDFVENQPNNFDYCLPAGCYTFTIYDNFGDGLEVPANYMISLEDSSFSAGGGIFESQESWDFCVDAVEVVGETEVLEESGLEGVRFFSDPETTTLQFFNPTEKRILVELVTLTGRKVMSDYFGQGQHTINYKNNLLSNNSFLKAGVYIIVLTLENTNQRMTDKIFLNAD